MAVHHWRVGGPALVLAGLAVVAASSGCDLVRTLAIQTAPQTEDVDPEYKGLEGEKALVYVWAKPETQWDYPQMRLDLTAHLTAYLKENVKNVELIPAPQVENHLKSLSTMNPEAGDLARHFHARKVVHVSIYKFSLRDPGLSQFYRGRMSGSVIVHELGKDGAVNRVPLQDVVIVVPEEGPFGYYNVTPDEVRDMTYREFTQAIGRKFHTWEKQLD